MATVADNATVLIVTTLIQFIAIYQLILIVRILMTWFQTFDWANQVAAFLSPITDPYLNIFRSFIPPLGGIDFSPILAFFGLTIIQNILRGLAASAFRGGF